MLNKLKYNLYRWKYNYADKLNLKKPVDVSLELTSSCTNTCGYCYHGDAKNLPFKRGRMSTLLAEKIIHEAHSIGVNSLKFNYRGESTLHPDFERITAYAKSLAGGMTFIDRVTNSNFNFRIDNDSIFRSLCNQTKVKISFDSFRKDIFESQRRGSNYEKTLANIDKFYNFPGRNNIMVVQAVRTKQNENEDLEYEIKSRWKEAVVSIRDVVGGRVGTDLSSVVIKDRDDSERQSCRQAQARLMIHWDGRVGPCCPSIDNSLIIGDANKQHILEIWKSKIALELRKSLKNKTAFDKHPCNGCSSFETYKGFKPRWDS